jgi:hypothetical protein
MTPICTAWTDSSSTSAARSGPDDRTDVGVSVDQTSAPRVETQTDNTGSDAPPGTPSRDTSERPTSAPTDGSRLNSLLEVSDD